jgi:hypothetical protein
MAIAMKRTGALGTKSVKFLGYGPAKVGKTRAIVTLPTPITFSCEGGLLVLKEYDLPYFEVTSLKDMEELYNWLGSEEASKFESVALDSITEMAEVVLCIEKNRTVDGKKIHGMKAYGEMQDKMAEQIRKFRDIKTHHVYFSAQMEKSQDELGAVLYAPAMPGNKFQQKLPFFFDEVFAFRFEGGHRAILTQTDGVWTAGDRSGRLNQWEPPDLGAIIRKIGGEG